MKQLRSAAALARALDQPLDPYVRALLLDRAQQVITEAAWLALVEPGDTLADVEAEVAFPLGVEGEPCFDWALLHPGAVYEVALDFGDIAHVLVVPDRDGVDPTLIALLRDHATPAPASSAAELG